MQEFSQLIVAEAQDLVYVKDDQFRYCYLNQQTLSVLGLEEKDVLGKTADELFPHTDCSAIRRDEQRVLAGNAVQSQIELNHQEALIYLDVRKYPIEVESKQFISAIARDLTHYRKQEYEHLLMRQRWEFALEGSGDGVWDWNAKTDETNFSPRILEMLGYAAGDWISDIEAWAQLLHPEDRGWVMEQDALQREGLMTSFSDEYRIQCKDGTYKWILDRGKVIEWDFDGKPLRIIGTHTDITQRKEMEEDLRFNEERFRALIENTRDIFWETDQHFNFTYISPQVDNLLLFSSGYFLGKTPLAMMARQEDAELFLAMASTGEFSPDVVRSRKFLLRRADGSEIFIEVDGHALMQENQIAGFRGIVRDVTEQMRAEEVLRFMAYHDPLTGLPNRKLFTEMAEKERKRATRHQNGFAVLFCDIDDFKAINDNCGHDIGDLTLCEVARRSTEVLRGCDVVSRLGGDEFTILLAEIDSQEAALMVADKVASAVGECSVGRDGDFSLTISFGVALYPQDGEDIHTLLRLADDRMFAQKRRKADKIAVS